MNTKNYLNAKPVRFSAEIEGEGMELCLRGLLMACLLTALAMCNLSIAGHRGQSAPADNNAAVALVKPATDASAKL